MHDQAETLACSLPPQEDSFSMTYVEAMFDSGHRTPESNTTMTTGAAGGATAVILHQPNGTSQRAPRIE
jgi:hypothetical protein